jgi:hypothetical protein
MKPTGLMLAVTLMVLQFLIEMLVVCNYAIAVAFITPAALLIASGAHLVTDVESLLWMRGVDTTLGCVVALAVYKILPRQSHVATVSQSLISTLTAAEAVIEALAAGPATGVSARLARRNLQHQAFFLDQTCDESVQASIRARDEAESFWPAVVATQRLAYRILAQGWGIDQAIVSDGVGPEYPLSNDGAWTREAISTVITAIRLGEPLSFTSSQRGIFASEIEALRVALSTALRKKD